jgi:long-chain acyl-CoA synthetase
VPDTAPAVALPGPDGTDRVAFSHRQLVAGATLVRAWFTDAFLGDETWLVLADLTSPLALAAILGTALGTRAQVVLLPRWTGQDVLDALRFIRPSYVLCDGDTVQALVNEPAVIHLALHHTRAILVGEPLHPSVSRAFAEATGQELCVGYAPEGMAGLATCNPVNGRRLPGSIGLPLPNVAARVTGPDGRPARGGETGVLELAGPHGPPGWLRTGLLARLDADGFVHPAGPAGRPAPAAALVADPAVLVSP